jgi:hypothetical protein
MTICRAELTIIILDSVTDETSTLFYGRTKFYRFSFDLPPTLPSSFQALEGIIHYKIIVSVKSLAPLSDDFEPDPIRIPFTVNKKVDLNENELALLPGELRDYRTFGIFANCILIRGYVAFNLRIEKRGFVPGELLPLQLQVSNNSSLKIKFIRAFIAQVISSVLWMQIVFHNMIHRLPKVIWKFCKPNINYLYSL